MEIFVILQSEIFYFPIKHTAFNKMVQKCSKATGFILYNHTKFMIYFQFVVGAW